MNYDHSMHFKDSKHKIRLTFQISTKPTSLDGVFFFWFLSRQQRAIRENSDNDNDTLRRPRKPLKRLLGDTGVASDTRDHVPGPVGNSPNNGGGCFKGIYPPKNASQTSFRLRNFSTLGGQLWWQKNTRGRFFFFSNQLNTIFCIGCLFVSFLLSFLAFLFTCLFFGFHLLALGINNVSSHSSRFFLVEFSRQEDLCHRKAHRLGNISPNDQFQMDGTKSCLARVYRKFTTQLYRH